MTPLSPDDGDTPREAADRVFCVLRNYSYFVDLQRKELAELCQECGKL